MPRKAAGANSVVSIFRGGKGVPYAEVVHDVADKLDVNYSDTMDVAAIEQQILLKVLEKSWEKMSDTERRDLLDTLGVDHRGGIPKALPVVAIQGAISLSGFVAYQIAIIVANAVARIILGRGLGLVVNAGLMRVMGALAGACWLGNHGGVDHPRCRQPRGSRDRPMRRAGCGNPPAATAQGVGPHLQPGPRERQVSGVLQHVR
jgi:uncharacterized protein YaaW (UPF0174 family)